MPRTAVGYLRQSVARQKDDRDGGSVSTAYQLAAVEKWCQINDVTLLAWYADVDESGASRNRKGLDDFTQSVKRLKPDYAAMWDIKRLARDLRLFLDVFDSLQETHTDIVSCTEGTRHPAFVWKMLVLFAEEERERISVNITHGKREATRRGRHLGPPPLGYVRGEDGILRVDDDTAWVVRWLFDRAMEGHTPTAICRMANERGLPTSGTVKSRMGRLPEGEPRGSYRRPEQADSSPALPSITQWSRRTVEAALRRPTYTGLVQSGAAARSKHGKQVPPVIAEGVHPPLIDRAVWQAVQRQLDGFGVDSAPRGTWHWLKGRVFCAACGSLAYYVEANRSDGGLDRYWKCSHAYQATFGRDRTRCPAPKRQMSDRILTPIVTDALKRVLTRPVDPIRIARHLHATRGAQAISVREQTERELAEILSQRLQIMDAIRMKVGILEEWGKQDAELAQREAVLKASLAALPLPTPPSEIERAIEIVHAAGRLIAGVEQLTPEQWANIATRIGLRVTVDWPAGTVAYGYHEVYQAVFIA